MIKIFLFSLTTFLVSSAFAGSELYEAFGYWSSQKFAEPSNCSSAISNLKEKYNSAGLFGAEGMFRVSVRGCAEVAKSSKFNKECFEKFDKYFMDPKSKVYVSDKINLSAYAEDNHCPMNADLYCKLSKFKSSQVNVGQLYDETKCEARVTCSENVLANGVYLKKDTSYKTVCKGTAGGLCEDLSLKSCPKLGKLGMFIDESGDEVSGAAPGQR
jgi:hypothetical protein